MTNSAEWPLPPVAQVRDFLPEDERSALLDWVLGNEQLFRPAKLMESRIAPEIRSSLTTRKLGPLTAQLEQRMLDALPSLECGTGSKVNATSVELELSAHGDGAFYSRHVDMQYDGGSAPVDRVGEDRVLSAVYYFHREPKAFTGGALRIYRFNIRPGSAPAGPDDYVDIEPLQNSLVAFAPWATHEVRPVACPSREFADYRFAVNCWFWRKL